MSKGKQPVSSARLTLGGISAADQAMINIAAGNIIQNVQQIQQRALSVVEQAQQAQALETESLALGVARLAQRLEILADQGLKAYSGGPYRGLLEYRLADAQAFHGRQQAISEMWLRLQQNPLTILHSESGAGKTSLLQAGLAPRLIATHNLPLLVRPYDQNPALSIKQIFLPNLDQFPGLQSSSLRDFLFQVIAVLGEGRALYIMLDQFEEFFTRLPVEGRKDFDRQLAACKDDETLPVRWVLALRSEAFSDLAFFQPLIKNPFENEYRLNRLSRSEAVEVITLSARSAGISYQNGLVETILDHLGGHEISPPEVQLVCSALVQGLGSGQTEITNEIYEGEGCSEGILRSHLGRVLRSQFKPDQRKVARSLLEALVNSQQQRLVRSQVELVEEMQARGVPAEETNFLLETLTTHRLLRSLEQERGLSFELTHDYLLGEIKLDPEVQARKAAQELLAQEVRVYQQTGSLIAEERLKFIQPFIAELAFTPEATLLVQESQKEVNRQAQEEVAQRERELAQALRLARIQRQRAIIFATGALISLVLLGFAILFFNRSQTALTDLESASTQSAQNEEYALVQASIAVHAETVSRGQRLAAQGQAQFEKEPLLGLRLAVEGLAVIPPNDQEERDAIRQTLVDMTATGRVGFLGNDVEAFYTSSESDRFVLDHRDGPGELRRLSDNALVAQLGENIVYVSFGQDPAQTYFVVFYCEDPCGAEQGLSTKDDFIYFLPQGEVRRSQDGELMPLSGPVERVDYYSGIMNLLFIDYDDHTMEVRSSFESPPLDIGEGVSQVKPLDVLDGTLFEFYDRDGKKLVRLDKTGQFTTLAQADSRAVFTFSSAPNFPYYFIDNPGPSKDEIRRLDDPAYRYDLQSHLKQVYFSPNPDHAFMILGYYKAPGKIIFPDGSSFILGQEYFGDEPNEIEDVYFSPNPEAEFFIVTYTTGFYPVGEVRSLKTGEVIEIFSDDLDDSKPNIIFSPVKTASQFVVHYSPYFGLHDNISGRFEHQIPYDFKALYFSDNPAENFFILGRLEEYGDRYDLSGEDIGTLSGFVEDVVFSPPGSQPYIIVDYGTQAGEILDQEELPGEIGEVVMGGKYLVIEFGNLIPSQLRLLQDASLVGNLPWNVLDILPNPGQDLTYFLVGETELWDDRSGFLVDLGLGFASFQLDWNHNHMLVRYRDGRAYILDLSLLSALGGKPGILTEGALSQRICAGPLASGMYDPAEFLEFLNAKPTISCP